MRGLWRRCSLASYKSASPEWEDVLDLDALNAKEKIPEGEQYVWHGYDVLDEGPGKAAWDRALVFLSPGGTDAQLVREFDLTTRSFVDGGFATADAAKCDVGFRTRDEVLIGTDFGPGSLTDSGYPRVVRSWKRGTPLESAKVVFEVEAGDISGRCTRTTTAATSTSSSSVRRPSTRPNSGTARPTSASPPPTTRRRL